MGENADHKTLGSQVLLSGEIAAKSQKFAEGYARLRDVTDRDGALPAWAKALFMASAAAVKGHDQLLHEELRRSKELGLSLNDARGAALTVFISRGEEVYSRFTAAVNEIYNEAIKIDLKLCRILNLTVTVVLNISKVILDLYLRMLNSWQTMLLEHLKVTY
ncbi:MAG: hypothetical protein Ct9H90mP30_5770 [Actinomycetota bacterium]|nr:MAG: hypothetical protein Ct9H90mP30_5770 [Actinomycetota bacterium]